MKLWFMAMSLTSLNVRVEIQLQFCTTVDDTFAVAFSRIQTKQQAEGIDPKQKEMSTVSVDTISDWSLC